MSEGTIYRIIFNKKFLKNPQDIPEYLLEHVSGPKIDRFESHKYVRVNQEDNLITGIDEEDVTEFTNNVIGEYVEGVIMAPHHLSMLSNANVLIRKIALKQIYNE